MKHTLTCAFPVLIFLLATNALHGAIISLQLNSSADFGEGYGYSDTIGGNGVYNAYLSQDNGVSFINSGDGASTAINLNTSSIGAFTYQFYYLNAFANELTLQLWSEDKSLFDPDIVVSTQRDTATSAFLPIFDPDTAPPFEYPSGTPPGSMQATIGGYVVTLTGFSFTNGSGPATTFSVTPGTMNSPEILGEFTYEVTAVPEPGRLVLTLLGLGAVLVRRSR